MAKRIFSLFILTVLLFSCLPTALAADTPNPIPVVEKENRTPTPKGVHHYMLICVDSWDAKGSFDKKQWGNHTDGLMLVTVDENAQRVMLTSGAMTTGRPIMRASMPWWKPSTATLT